MPNSKFETPEELTLEASLPDIKTLEITNVEHGFENNQGFVKVVTNQTISVQDLEKIYKIEINGASEPVEEPVYEYDSLGNPIVKVTIEQRAELDAVMRRRHGNAALARRARCVVRPIAARDQARGAPKYRVESCR